MSDAASISVGGNVVRSFTYDGRGRRKTDTYAGATTTYAWDAESRLTSLARPGVTTSSFGYNGLDARVSKTDSTGTFSFKRNGAGVTDPVLSDGAATYTPGISERRGVSSKFLHSGMKNADAQSGASANVDSSRTYDAFGNLTGASGTWSGPFGYAGGFGYQEDPDHGLRLLGHRYYDSSTGRFISKDPIGDGRNWTAYGAGETAPTHFADPDGLWRVRLMPFLDRAGRAVGDFFRGLGRLRPPGSKPARSPAGGKPAGSPANVPLGGNRPPPTAKAPVGRKGAQQPELQIAGRNTPTTIRGREYSGHALDRMQQRGIPPLKVEDVIRYGTRRQSKLDANAWEHVHDGITVVTDKATGRVVTVMYSGGK